MKTKAQGGIEFLIITGAAIFFFTLFFVAIQISTEEKNKEKENIIVKNLALSVKDEINLATEASEGYTREFYIPELISGKDYEINIVDNSIYIKTDSSATSLSVNKITGEIKKGKNTIKKENGKVYLN